MIMGCSISVSTPPVHVKSSTVVFEHFGTFKWYCRIRKTEILTGWQMSEACYDDPHSCELTHFNFSDDHDLVVILKLLDKVRDGFFQVNGCDSATSIIMVASSARRPRGSTANSLSQQTLGGD